MNIYEQETELFRKWKAGRTGFAPDGVVSEKDYLNSDPKIVFILKEVNDPGSEGWDLRDYLWKGADKGGTTWNNVARWAYGIRNRKSFQRWKNFPYVDIEFRTEELKNICAMNLKKEPGGGRTKYQELVDATKKDSKFIRKQYALYDADITICGGGHTGELFKGVVREDNDKEWKKKKEIPHFWWYETSANKYVVSAPHPQAPIKTEELFWQFMKIVNKIYS